MRIASPWFLEGLGFSTLSAVLLCSAAGATSLEASHAERAEGAPGLVLLQFEIAGGSSVGAASLELAATLSDLAPSTSVEFAQLSIIGGPGALPSVDEISALLPRARHFYVHGARAESIFDVGEFMVEAICTGSSFMWLALKGSAREDFAQLSIDLSAKALLHLQEMNTIPDAAQVMQGRGTGEDNPQLEAAESSPIEDQARLTVGPNPAQGSTRIMFRPHRDGRYRVSVFDLRGREVFSEWFDGAGGMHEVLAWAGTNNDGMSVAAGVYTVRVIGQGTTHIKSFVLLH